MFAFFFSFQRELLAKCSENLVVFYDLLNLSVCAWKGSIRVLAFPWGICTMMERFPCERFYT